MRDRDLGTLDVDIVLYKDGPPATNSDVQGLSEWLKKRGASPTFRNESGPSP